MKNSKLKILGGALILLFALAIIPLGTGCQSTQRVAYAATATTSITVNQALKAYDVFAAQGKTTIAQNQQVKAAYEKYQKAVIIVCDAGALVANASGTNAPTASALLDQAILSANQNIADLVDLIRSFGVKI